MAQDELKTIPANVYLAMGGQVFQVTKLVTKLGRQLDNHLVLQDNTVSRYHAEVHFEGGEFFIYDLGSTGGVYINNQKVNEKSLLHSGDIIMLANMPVMFVVETTSMRQSANLDTDNLNKNMEENDGLPGSSEKTNPIP